MASLNLFKPLAALCEPVFGPKSKKNPNISPNYRSTAPAAAIMLYLRVFVVYVDLSLLSTDAGITGGSDEFHLAGLFHLWVLLGRGLEFGKSSVSLSRRAPSIPCGTVEGHGPWATHIRRAIRRCPWATHIVVYQTS